MREGTAVYECDFVETEGKWLKKDVFYAEDKALQLKDTFQAHDRASNVGQRQDWATVRYCSRPNSLTRLCGVRKPLSCLPYILIFEVF
jgi:hypothetical protein